MRDDGDSRPAERALDIHSQPRTLQKHITTIAMATRFDGLQGSRKAKKKLTLGQGKEKSPVVINTVPVHVDHLSVLRVCGEAFTHVRVVRWSLTQATALTIHLSQDPVLACCQTHGALFSWLAAESLLLPL